MKAKYIDFKIGFDDNGELILGVDKQSIKQAENTARRLAEAVKRGKTLDFDIKTHREHRSTNANAYLWVLCEKIGNYLWLEKEEVYTQMLLRFGVFTHLIVKENAVEKVMNEWRACRNLGNVSVNGTDGVQLQCYFGSSTYDTAEMSRLIDGVVAECERLGIETLPPNELEVLKKGWGK